MFRTVPLRINAVLVDELRKTMIPVTLTFRSREQEVHKFTVSLENSLRLV